MPNLTIKSVPDDLYERLKDDATRSRRSLNQEAIRQLEQGLAGDLSPDPELLARVIEEMDAFRHELTRRGFHTTTEEIDAIINEGRDTPPTGADLLDAIDASRDDLAREAVRTTPEQLHAFIHDGRE